MTPEQFKVQRLAELSADAHMIGYDHARTSTNNRARGVLLVHALALWTCAGILWGGWGVLATIAASIASAVWYGAPVYRFLRAHKAPETPATRRPS